MKNFKKMRITLTLALMVVGLSSALAQQLNTTGLYKHGTNSASAGLQVPHELTDSVTVDAVTDYFVMPDALYNPLYVPATSLTANLVSTFTWSVTPAGPAIAAKGAFLTNYKAVTWPTAGSFTLNVKENGASGCVDGGTGRDIPIAVINKPTANFSSATITECTATPATQSFTLPLSLGTDLNNGRLTVDLSIVFTPTVGGPTTTPYNNIALTESGTLNLQAVTGALAYGKYEITIVSVRDRISVKSNVAGTIGGTPLYTYNLIRLPQTGEIYHIPNI